MDDQRKKELEKFVRRTVRQGKDLEYELGKRAGMEECENKTASAFLDNSGLREIFGDRWTDGFVSAVEAWETLHGEMAV